MTCWSYGVFLGLLSASFNLAIPSGYFLAWIASCAALRVLARSRLTCGFLSSANAGRPAKRLVAVNTATTRASAARVLPRDLIVVLRIVRSLIPELRSIHETDLPHAVALGGCQNPRHVVILGTPV